jgi:hypothetical protein
LITLYLKIRTIRRLFNLGLNKTIEKATKTNRAELDAVAKKWTPMVHKDEFVLRSNQ